MNFLGCDLNYSRVLVTLFFVRFVDIPYDVFPPGKPEEHCM